jgi:oxygen-dependent protoporphyrinogen oxidase
LTGIKLNEKKVGSPEPFNKNSMGKSQKSIAILGGGITVLAAAYELGNWGTRQPFSRLHPALGASLKPSTRRFPRRMWPQYLLETSPRIGKLITDLGLDSRKRYANPEMKNRYIVKGGKPVAMPFLLVSSLPPSFFHWEQN